MFQKHDSTVLLEILSAFSVVALLAIAFALFDISGAMKENAKAPIKADAGDMSPEGKKITAEDLSPDLLSEINAQFNKLNNDNLSFQDFMGFYFQKTLTKEQFDSLQKEYSELLQSRKEAQQQTPVSSVPENPPSASPAQ